MAINDKKNKIINPKTDRQTQPQKEDRLPLNGDKISE